MKTALTDEHWCNLITFPGKTGSVQHYNSRNYITVAGFKIALLLFNINFPIIQGNMTNDNCQTVCLGEGGGWSPVHCSKHTHDKIVAKQPHPVTNNDGNVSTSG